MQAAAAQTKKKKKIKGFGGVPKKKAPGKFGKLKSVAPKAAAKAPVAERQRPKSANNAMDKDRYAIILRLPESMREPLNRVREEDQVSINTYIYDLVCTALANRPD